MCSDNLNVISMSNLNEMSKDQLVELINQQQKEIAKLKPRAPLTSKSPEIVKLKDEIKKIGDDRGIKPRLVFIELAKRFGFAGSFKEAQRAIAKYKNPDNPRQTWSGKRDMPEWLDKKVKSGKKLEDFLVQYAKMSLK